MGKAFNTFMGVVPIAAKKASEPFCADDVDRTKKLVVLPSTGPVTMNPWSTEFR